MYFQLLDVLEMAKSGGQGRNGLAALALRAPSASVAAKRLG